MPELEFPPKRVVEMLGEVKPEELEAFAGMDNTLSIMPVDELAPEVAERDGDKR